MTITFDIPHEIFSALGLSPEEAGRRVMLELAVALHAQSLLSHGKASELAGMDWFEFNDVLARRGVPLSYGQKELADDIAYGRCAH